MKVFLFFCTFFISLALSAASTVDIYGDRDRSFDKGILSYAKKISQLEADMYKLFAKGKLTKEDERKLLEASAKKIVMAEKIRKLYGFLYVGIDSINYGKGKIYTTVEVISKDTPQRFHYFGPDYLNEIKESKNDIIDKAIAYYELGGHLFAAGKLDQKNNRCMGLHCVWGFGNPKLLPYKKLFEKAIKTDKNYIINTLTQAKNPQRRIGAIILLGFMSDPHELIPLMIPYVNDPNEGVRNIAMRAISTTLMSSKINNLDVTPYLHSLNSPLATDRNKALYVLVSLAKSKSSQPIIIKEAGDKLVDNLELKQPNNHAPAYEILKEISGKNFGEYDIQSWRNWISQARKNLRV